MLSGVKEFLIIAIVLIGLFFLPRLLRSRKTDGAATSKVSVKKTGNAGLIRLALLLSGIWVVSAFFLMNPMSGKYMPFVGIGILPVALGWGIRWVVLGFK